MSSSVRGAAAASIQDHLRSLISVSPPSELAPGAPRRADDPPVPLVARPRTVAAYVPVGAEPGGADLPDLLAGTLASGGRLLLPVLLDDGDLDWALYAGPLSLRPGPRGLREPTGDRLGVAAINEAELVIVPAMAVDATGMRLGRGGGSYDRALARATSAFTVALLHDGEIVDRVPAEEHDRPVRAVITPSGGVTLSVGLDWTK